jgi:hypothetical protein
MKPPSAFVIEPNEIKVLNKNKKDLEKKIINLI